MTLAGRGARSDATVLIQGDTGTGKEGMARFLHAQSGRVSRDFIAVNCAALPETMMEAMLFGHKKGSFTGAVQASEGLFRSEEHTSELQSLMRISYAVFCLKKKNSIHAKHHNYRKTQ